MRACLEDEIGKCLHSSKPKLYVVAYRFEWNITSETEYFAKISRNFEYQTPTFKSEFPSTFKGTS